MQRNPNTPTRAELVIGILTALYVTVFTVWFFSIGNYEFIVYVVTMLALIAFVGLNLRKAEFPPVMLFSLSLWGLMHMAGGGVPVNGSVLYNLHLLPIAQTEHYFILKYDQFVHAYGFGVTAWVLAHLLRRHFPGTRGTMTAFFYPLLAATGLGAVNEVIEFSAVLAVPETNVGGYYNTALDLVFNFAGALIALGLVKIFSRPDAP